MASIINASTAGAGGVITTADASGELQIQSAGSTVATVTGSGVAVTGTLSSSGAISSSSTVAGATGTLYPLVSGTAVASTSGTSIDFTGIPSWVKRITVMFNGVSTNGTSSFLIQLGDSGGVETTGYLGSGFYFSTGGNNTNSTAGFIINTFAQVTTIYGQMTINLLDSTTNTWTQNGIFSAPAATLSFYSSGVKPLSATLDRVRITTTSGTDTFDAGSINILYE
jgi:hypothetical protein